MSNRSHMSGRMQWKRVRVVVEVPARGNLLTERSLAQSTRMAIADAGEHLRGVFRTGGVGGIGAWRVLEYTRLTRAKFGAIIPAREIEKHQSDVAQSNLALARLAAEHAFRSCEKGHNLQFAMARVEELLTGESSPLIVSGAHSKREK